MVRYRDWTKANWKVRNVAFTAFTSGSQTVSCSMKSREASSSNAVESDTYSVFLSESAAASRPNSLRGAKFAALQEALLTLASFPEGHDFHLDQAAATRASSFLGLLSNNLDIDPPRLFPQDGEAAVFTWDLGAVKRLLTVDAEEEDLMDINRNTMMRCDYDLPIEEELRLAALLDELGAQHLTLSSSLSGVDA